MRRRGIILSEPPEAKSRWPSVHRQGVIMHNGYGAAACLFNLKLNHRDQEDATPYATAFGFMMETFLTGCFAGA